MPLNMNWPCVYLHWTKWNKPTNPNLSLYSFLKIFTALIFWFPPLEESLCCVNAWWIIHCDDQLTNNHWGNSLGFVNTSHPVSMMNYFPFSFPIYKLYIFTSLHLVPTNFPKFLFTSLSSNRFNFQPLLQYHTKWCSSTVFFHLPSFYSKSIIHVYARSLLVRLILCFR